MAYPEYDFIFKLLLVGRSGVGKTSIIHGFSSNLYPPPPPVISNIGVDFSIKTVEIDNKIVKLQIWDTAGQERFRTITSAYYRGCSGVLLVYDITHDVSFQDIEHWLSEVRKYASDNVQVMILGNKSDLTETRQVSSERGRMFAEEHGLKFMETSAKTGENVELAFMTLAKDIKYDRELSEEADTKANVVSSSVNHSTPSTASRCC